MDGYAVRVADIRDASLSEPARLEVLEDLPAGFVAGPGGDAGTGHPHHDRRSHAGRRRHRRAG